MVSLFQSPCGFPRCNLLNVRFGESESRRFLWIGRAIQRQETTNLGTTCKLVYATNSLGQQSQAMLWTTLHCENSGELCAVPINKYSYGCSQLQIALERF